jgi:hypothetical protein
VPALAVYSYGPTLGDSTVLDTRVDLARKIKMSEPGLPIIIIFKILREAQLSSRVIGDRTIRRRISLDMVSLIPHGCCSVLMPTPGRIYKLGLAGRVLGF